MYEVKIVLGLSDGERTCELRIDTEGHMQTRPICDVHGWANVALLKAGV